MCIRNAVYRWLSQLVLVCLMTIGQSEEARAICTQTRYSLRPHWDGESDTSALGRFDLEAALLRSV
jgi:hypothetical protein